MEPVHAPAEEEEAGPGARPVARLLEACEDFVGFMGFLSKFVAPRLSDSAAADAANQLLADVTPVYRAERALLRSLAASSDQTLGAAFASHLEALEAAYRPYVQRYAARAAALTQALTGPLAADVRSVWTAPEAAERVGGFDLADLLQMPLLQPARWAWFLSQVAAAVPEAESSARAVRECAMRLQALDEGAPDAQQRALAQLDAEVQPPNTLRDKVHRKMRRRDAPRAAGPGRVLLKRGDVRYLLPRAPNTVHQGRLYVCNDTLLLLNGPTLVHKVDLNAVVPSQRHEPRVGDDANTRESSFSLFCNRGNGRLEHLVLVAPNAAERHAWLSKLLTAANARANVGREQGARVRYFLVRERKPGQGRSNEYGAEFHLMLWGFGPHTMYRCDPDTGALIGEYRCSELEAFDKWVTREAEQRVLVRTTWETFELSSVAVVDMLLCLRVIMRRKLERGGVRTKRRQQLLPAWAREPQVSRSEALRQAEDRVRAETTQTLNARLQDRLGHVEQAYSELSHALYQRETEVAELQRQLASRNAPVVDAEFAAGMTPLERTRFAGTARRREDLSTSLSYEDSDHDFTDSSAEMGVRVDAPQLTSARAQPTSARGQPTSSRGQPTSSRGQPTSARGQPTSARGQPTSSRGQPTSARGQPASTAAKAKPLVISVDVSDEEEEAGMRSAAAPSAGAVPAASATRPPPPSSAPPLVPLNKSFSLDSDEYEYTDEEEWSTEVDD